jgi:hypothetical protein
LVPKWPFEDADAGSVALLFAPASSAAERLNRSSICIAPGVNFSLAHRRSGKEGCKESGN